MWRGARIDLLDAALLLAAILLVDMGTTAFNSFFDYLRGVDERRRNREDDKVLVHAGVAPGAALIVSVALFFAAAVIGVVLALRTSAWIIVAGAVGMLVGFLYNGGPLPISRTPVGEWFAGGFLGGVLFLTVVYVHGGSTDAATVVAALPSTLMIAGVLAANNVCDMAGDRASGRATFAVLVGRTGAAVYLYLLLLGGFAVIVVLAAVDRLPAVGRVFGAAGVIASSPILVSMARRGFSHESKRHTMVSVLWVIMIYTATYAATLVWSLAL